MTPTAKLRELAGLYEPRGLPPALAREVGTLASRGVGRARRDELGLDEDRLARPFQAAWTSALSFAAGATPSLMSVAALPAGTRVAGVVTLIALGLLG